MGTEEWNQSERRLESLEMFWVWIEHPKVCRGGIPFEFSITYDFEN